MSRAAVSTDNEDLLIGYALGALSSEEEARVEAYLRRHPDAAAEVAETLAALADFALSAAPEALPEGGEKALLLRLRRAQQELPPVRPDPGPPRGRRRVLVGLTAAAAALLAATLLLLPPRTPEAQLAQQLRDYQSQPGAESFALTPTPESGLRAPLGTLVRLTDGELLVVLEAGPASGQVYQAWEISGGTPRSLGTFAGRSFVGRARPGSTFGLTVEPPGGSPQPTSAPIALLEL